MVAILLKVNFTYLQRVDPRFFLQIPVYMVTSKSANEISGWILGCITQIFQDFDELKQFLKDKYS